MIFWRLSCSVAVASMLCGSLPGISVAADTATQAGCPQADSPTVHAARAKLAASPEELEPRLALSAALRDHGCYAEAVRVLEEGGQWHGRDDEFQARLRTARSNVSEQQYIEGLGRAEEAAKLQRNLLRCGQLGDLAACDEALKSQPNDAKVLAAQGDALLKAGRPSDAAAAYRRAFVVDPADRTLAARIAAADQQRSRFATECNSGDGGAAVRACDAALVRGAPDEFAIHRRKGLLLQRMGESSRALDAYIAADSVKSGDQSVALAIVSLTDDGKRSDAIALAARGSALLALGRSRDAAVALRQARALSPGLPDLGRKLAAAERLARTESRTAPAASAVVAANQPAKAAPPPARRYSNDAPTTRSH